MAKPFILQAIVTKYIGPTDTRGSRVKATAAAGSVTLHWDSALNSESNHAAAAQALANKYGWRGAWYCGGMPNDSGYVFVCNGGDDPVFATEGKH
jgi:hypothetical protein